MLLFYLFSLNYDFLINLKIIRFAINFYMIRWIN